MEVRTLKATSKETKQHICKAKPKGLPNQNGKKNDEKLERIEVGPWCGCHLQKKETNKMGERYLNYKVCEIELVQKEDHPKDPLNK